MKKKFALAIHGGAGTLLPSEITPEKADEIQEALQHALYEGKKCLMDGGTAVDAVEIAVTALEDCPLFNAGKGAVMAHDGSFEMEASIMSGQTLEAGAVAGIRGIKNPIHLAKKIHDDMDFVFMHGEGALKFAKRHQLQEVKDEYFFTQSRYKQWLMAKETNQMLVDHDGERKFGTVGAVALDHEGNLAAATSTGGLVNKKYGRLGDSSVIGSGTYANNESCAVSCTGYGEFFLKATVARDIAAYMEMGQLSLKEASDKVVHDKLVKMEGEGGIIAVDHEGNIELSFNSEGMYRGWTSSEEQKLNVAIFK
ncbi:isoaspartyl peptidase/L-asparaginase family protein [Flammeovirga sp. SJP92]|uniref:isoaspartyl peptidase/L-asparaginase family protein n=1 Tax=Flammeovirga sp. SJP92 TaxID=1775430 RepID=UPI000786D89C|nr:isoaspartyl peptidase/L-asparaginase [Flammeovirga sp. SJP92]KXX69373.1 isoaspartyl peptidase [Flammeovirga sp. SJP92]